MDKAENSGDSTQPKKQNEGVAQALDSRGMIRDVGAEKKGLAAAILSSPWIFIPAIYLIQGVIEGGVLQDGVTIMYKDMGYSNAFIGYLSFIHLPLTMAFLWAPFVDQWGSKRNLTVVFFFIVTLFTAFIGFTLYIQVAFTTMSVIAFLGLAIIFSFFRIAIDGYYIRILPPRLQAGFVGVKTAAIRIGIIATIALLINLAGRVNEAQDSKTVGWIWMYGILTGLVLLGAIYNLFCLPKAADDKPVRDTKGFPLLEAIKDYLTMNKVALVIIFIFIFRFGEGLLRRMAPPFFMDPVDAGGYALDVASVSMIRAFADMPFTIVGGLLGGWIIKKWGLKRTFVVLAICMSAPNLLYWYVAKVQTFVEFSFWGYTFNRAVFITVCIESLGYGMGFSAFFYFMHAIAKGMHKTSHFAISTALMSLGFFLPSGISGIMQEHIGYEMLFLVSAVAAIPGICMIPFLPIGREE